MNFIRIVFTGLIIFFGFLLVMTLPQLILHGELDAIFIVLMLLVLLDYALKNIYKKG
ncbi:hypothetical protein [Leuconostoc inhae]|uniref:hypothetical protein n=1 Tax=Leuconostoc inhae TaxID=178001 RepID=UPI001C7E141D|nr:hypothetical protein [Leuconostoc inhae]